MSNPFQVGDTLRVLPTEAQPLHGLHANTHVTVEHADETHVRVSGSTYEWHARRFELVKRADATPAPLDIVVLRSDLQAGDKVIDPAFQGNSNLVRVERHQPAPEPEPEWKPGTTGTATVAHLAGGTAVLDMRVMRVEWDGLFGFATQTGRIVEDGSTEWSVYDLMPDEPRPMPTREQIAVAIARADSHESQSNFYLKNADAVLALLRGEVR